MKRKMTGLALLAVTVVAAGCGGDGGDEAQALTKADYLKQGNKICTDFNKDVGKDAEKIFAGLQSEKDLTAEKAREFFDVALPKFNAVVEDLDALGPPKGDEETVQAIIDAGKADSLKIDEAEDDDKAILAFVLKDTATPAFDQKADAYGLGVCGTKN